ncbi:hypothetical protein QPX44_03135 [Corynebacterium pseudodiphtheriticum]|uniref:hypothetical protein n=1 Tax=Corynebacterium pseudodiphtheriticum TaxID=37637 RepID=UPI001EF4576E|nr:hypothetical protein [Corynebacterium pseudodiphtheriticum]MCG7251280.1 hypothetical protein [Corynebacterium pseudodiphtheriticum]MDK4285381.1 hypothetical protein [Corynebacterium pseudodiphtheriticum]MDK4315168.1 hypothetical protein [Corynebacterium pseudodiphtheriticum]MDK4338480.1 hypothetical protein [Corynebacterium pseudodiphtheriticum]
MEENWLHQFLAWDFRAPHVGLAEMRNGVAAAIAAGVGAVVVSPNHVATAAKTLDRYVRQHGGDHYDDDADESSVLTIITAVGFPTGRHHILVKASEARLAVSQGAHRVWACVDTSNTDANALLSDMISLREAVPAPAQLGVVVPDYSAAGKQFASAPEQQSASAAGQQSGQLLEQLAGEETWKPETRRGELVSTCDFAKVDQLVVTSQTKYPASWATAQQLPDRIPIVLDMGAGTKLAESPAADSSLVEWLVAESADLAANKKALEKTETAKQILAVIPVPVGATRKNKNS